MRGKRSGAPENSATAATFHELTSWLKEAAFAKVSVAETASEEIGRPTGRRQHVGTRAERCGEHMPAVSNSGAGTHARVCAAMRDRKQRAAVRTFEGRDGRDVPRVEALGVAR